MIASALCGRASAQKSSAEAPPAKPNGAAAVVKPDTSLAAVLRKGAGGAPVLLAIVNDAVEARSADGTFKLVIAPAPAADAVYDAALELIWVRRLGQLEVWDLREDKPKAIVILADAPDLGDFTIERGNHLLSPRGMCDVTGTMTIKWSKHPSVAIVGYDDAEPLRPRLVGSAWLASQFDRPLRSVSLTRADPSLTAVSHVWVPRKVGTCSDPQDCGRGVPFGNTGWTLVVVSEEQGDCEHFGCVLYAPRTKRFGKPPLPEKWKPNAQKSMVGECGLYRFEPEGKWFVVTNQVCAVGGTCSTLAELARVIGWLDGERDVGTDD
jgi:hypothetical protein